MHVYLFAYGTRHCKSELEIVQSPGYPGPLFCEATQFGDVMVSLCLHNIDHGAMLGFSSIRNVFPCQHGKERESENGRFSPLAETVHSYFNGGPREAGAESQSQFQTGREGLPSEQGLSLSGAWAFPGQSESLKGGGI
jgi:hypothetical protein